MAGIGVWVHTLHIAEFVHDFTEILHLVYVPLTTEQMWHLKPMVVMPYPYC